MKKFCSVFLIILLVFLCACTAKPVQEAEETPEVTENIVVEGEGFKIVYISEDGGARYKYTVTAHDGTEIESAFCSNKPKVAVINDDLIGVRFFNDNKSFCRYFDLKNGLASRSYFNPFWDNGKLVAYNDFRNSGKLIVCDIFDEDGYVYEAEIDSEAMQLTVMECTLSDDETELTVRYEFGDGSGNATYHGRTILELVPAETDDLL